MRVARHIIWIVKIYKTILHRWGIEKHGPDAQQDRKQKDQPPVGRLSRAWQSAI
jgi:hypothetical protein